MFIYAQMVLNQWWVKLLDWCPLAQIKTVVTNCRGQSLYSLPSCTHSKKGKKKKATPFLLNKVLEEVVKIIYFIKSWPLNTCLFNVLQTKWDVCIKHGCYTLKCDAVWEKSTCATVWEVVWNRHFYHGTPFLLVRMTNKLSLFQMWVSGRHFLGNERNETVILSKTGSILPTIKFELSRGIRILHHSEWT